MQDHVLHIQRLREVKPAVTNSEPIKAKHLSQNLKREIKKLGKSNFKMWNLHNSERLTEIEFENKVLLKKMLHIDNTD